MAERAVRGWRPLGHPVHPPLSHLAVGLLAGATLCDALGLASGDPRLWLVAYYDLSAGVLTAMLAALAGLMDYATLPAGHPAARTAGAHMAAMLASVAAYATSLLARGGPLPAGPAGAWALGLSGLGCLLLAVGGWLGGELVFRHGVGVRACREPPRPPAGTRGGGPAAA